MLRGPAREDRYGPVPTDMSVAAAPRLIAGLPVRLAVYVASVVAVAAPLLAASFGRIASKPPTSGTAAALGLFLALALVAELMPVPMDADGTSEVSITNVFTVAVAVVFGWEYAVPLAAVAVGASMIPTGRSAPRIAFNVGMYAISAFAAAVPALVAGPRLHHPFELTLVVLAGGACNLLANVFLVSGAFSLAEGRRYRSVLVEGLRHGGAAFAIMSFLAALTANLWVTDAWLLILLAGPLLTLTLYQHSALRSRIALRDARTDNLTGLGNHRAYQEALRERIAESDRTGEPFSLCLVDLDDFKQINDSFGHPAGDELLVRLSRMLAGVDRGQAFRFGGDELALLVSSDELSAYREIERIQHELGIEPATPLGPTTISVGIATYPAHARTVEELQRTADGALLWAKAHGKNRSCLYSDRLAQVLTPRDLEREAERSARLRAAKNLVRFVDARDPSTASHSQFVSSLAAGIGAELGLDEDAIDHLRLAGLLHDIGKIGLPDTILRAPRRLTGDEAGIVQRHPELGSSLLEGIGVEPIGEWVLRHHEHWDGSGYPGGLAGDEIPLGARIILVADAFEAITSDRPYRLAQSPEVALEELRRNAGTQFDPDVVAALERHLASVMRPTEALA
ncbi:MAG: diguanylate cyclase [Actinobacteria bacterium]|nr:diguanylate cyclase [Actinomycetota bacterium]